MVEITDEMVEAAAREGCGFMSTPDGALTSDGKIYFTGFDLRAALEAVAPALFAQGFREGLEKAAEIVDGSVRQECCGFGQGSPPECCGCPNIEFDDPANTATAIRALKEDMK